MLYWDRLNITDLGCHQLPWRKVMVPLSLRSSYEASERHNEEAAQFIEQKQIEQRPPRQCIFHIQPLHGHQARRALSHHRPHQDSDIYVYSVTVENETVIDPIGLTASDQWKTNGCIGLWKNPENASIIDVMKMLPGRKGHFSDPDSIIEVSCAIMVTCRMIYLRT